MRRDDSMLGKTERANRLMWDEIKRGIVGNSTLFLKTQNDNKETRLKVIITIK